MLKKISVVLFMLFVILNGIRAGESSSQFAGNVDYYTCNTMILTRYPSIFSMNNLTRSGFVLAGLHILLKENKIS